MNESNGQNAIYKELKNEFMEDIGDNENNANINNEEIDDLDRSSLDIVEFENKIRKSKHILEKEQKNQAKFDSLSQQSKCSKKNCGCGKHGTQQQQNHNNSISNNDAVGDISLNDIKQFENSKKQSKQQQQGKFNKIEDIMKQIVPSRKSVDYSGQQQISQQNGYNQNQHNAVLQDEPEFNIQLNNNQTNNNNEMQIQMNQKKTVSFDQDNAKNIKLSELRKTNQKLQQVYEREHADKQTVKRRFEALAKDTGESLQSIQEEERQMAIIRKQPLPNDLLTNMNIEVTRTGNTMMMEEENFNSSNVSSGDFKARYQTTEKKLSENRLRLHQVKSDLQKAQRLLQREIGEEVNIDDLMKDNKSWKGRHSQIQTLQQKLKQMQDSNTQEKRPNTQQSSASASSHISSGRAEKEKSEEKVKFSKHQNEQLHTQIKGLCSRNAILENKIKENRTQFSQNKQMLMDKSDNDDNYIEALKKEIKKEEALHPSVETRVIYKTAEPTPKVKKQLDTLNDAQKVMENHKKLSKELKRKDKVIKELIGEKMKNSTQSYINDQTQKINQEDAEQLQKLEMDIQQVQSQVINLKQENQSIYKQRFGERDNETFEMMIQLSRQNQNLKKKIEEMNLTLQNKS